VGNHRPPAGVTGVSKGNCVGFGGGLPSGVWACGPERSAGCVYSPSARARRCGPAPIHELDLNTVYHCRVLPFPVTESPRTRTEPGTGRRSLGHGGSVPESLGERGPVSCQPLPRCLPADHERSGCTADPRGQDQVVPAVPMDISRPVHAAGLVGPHFHQRPSGLEPRAERPLREGAPGQASPGIPPRVHHVSVGTSMLSRCLDRVGTTRVD
jgi:hypothetical protein